MPIYDYLCSNCAMRTEVVHGIDAPAPRFCPACGADGTLRKLFVPPAVHFKGSGWAKKDRSGSGASKTRAATTTGDSKDGAGSAAGKDAEAPKKADPPAAAAGTTPGEA